MTSDTYGIEKEREGGGGGEAKFMKTQIINEAPKSGPKMAPKNSTT